MNFQFGNVVVFSTQNKITKNSQTLNCEPLIFELLLFFCNHPNQAHSREFLIKKVWKGRVVSDAAINRAIGELRKLIEDKPSSPQWIKTVSKIGYQLTVTPSIIEDRKTSNFQHPLERHAHSFDKEILLNKKLYIAFTFLVVAIIVFLLSNSKDNVDDIRIFNFTPVTLKNGSAFNPSFNTEENTLVFLYRPDTKSFAQPFSQRGDDEAKPIINDDFYYTDIIYPSDRFVYASRLNNLEQRFCDIVKIDMNTKQIEKVLDCGEGVITQLAFDNDSKRLFFQHRRLISEPYSIHSVYTQTGRRQQITSPDHKGNNLGDYLFSLSEDRNHLAVIEYVSEEADRLKLINLQTNKEYSNTSLKSNISGLVWQDNENLLFSSAEGLFTVNINDFSISPVDHTVEQGRLASSGLKDVYFTERSSTTVNIVKYPINEPESIPVTFKRGVNLTPILGNNSNILAFKSNSSNKEVIYIQREGKPAFEAKFNSTIKHVSAMAWSPDDEILIASINDRLYSYSLKNNRWTQRAEEHNKVHHVTFVDGSIMFSAELNGVWNIWKISDITKAAQKVTQNGGYSVQGHADKIYYTKFNQKGLYQLELKTANESTVIKDYPVRNWRSWQLRDNNIYFFQDKNYQKLDLLLNKQYTLLKFDERVPQSCHMSADHNFFMCDKIELSISNIWNFQLASTP